MSTLQIIPLADEQWRLISISLVRDSKYFKTRGLHKLVQRTVFFLATDPRSVHILPNYGNTYKDQLMQVSLSEVSVIERIISELSADLERDLRLITNNSPEDEQLGSLEMSLSSIEEDGIIILVEITSVAGDSATFSQKLIIGGR